MLFKNTLFCLLLICQGWLWAQVSDDFSDGDFLMNPAWEGETSLWQVSPASSLQSRGPSANDEIHLVTANSLVANTEWTGSIQYTAGGPSTANFVRVYLVSDERDLEGDLNGYYLQLGETGSNDAVELYRQDGSSSSLLIRGADGLIGGGIDLRYRVQRDGAGNWSLDVDSDGDMIWEPQGSALDATHTGTSWFGFMVRHSATRNESFFFDDVYVGPPVVDTDPPEAISVTVESNDSLTVLLSERLAPGPAENPGNFTLLNGNLNPVASVLLAPDSTRLGLKFGAPFSQNTQYQLVIANQEDRNGNVAPGPDTLAFFFFIPDEPEPGDVVIHEVMADPTPAIGLPDGEYVELYNRTFKTFSTAGWTFSNGTVMAVLPDSVLKPGEFLVLIPAGDEAKWSFLASATPLSPWTALVNSGDNLGLRDAGGELLDTLDYDISWYGDGGKEDGGFSLEMIDPDNRDCPPKSNWRASAAAAGGTPGFPNSFGALVDNDPPVLLSASIVSANVIEICFDEALDPGIAGMVENYSLGNGANIFQASPVTPDFECVRLALGTPLQEGVIVELTVSGLADCKGNALTNAISTELLFSGLPEVGDIVINEFLADFTPVVGLPEAEFVELYNRSANAYNLNGWALADASSQAALGPMVIRPGEFVILCSDDEVALFESYGKVLGISGFPGLNNTGDQVSLLGPDGTMIDGVRYELGWYRDFTKANGGWTLERIDPEVFGCNTPLNWQASEFPAGGTPGFENSAKGIVQDTVAPAVTGVGYSQSANGFELRFSEVLREASLDGATFELVSVGPADGAVLGNEQDEIRLTFFASLSPGTVYELRYDGLEDCFGNIASGTVRVGIPQSALPGDILLNEVLFNPYTGAYDFVEIINVSESVLELNELELGEGSPEFPDSVFNVDPLTVQSTLLLPGQIVCLTRFPFLQKGLYRAPDTANFLEMSGFPSYADNEGVVVLRKRFLAGGEELDRFAYQDDFHFVTLADDNGVSLERISTEAPTQDPANWHSAASTVNFATPGYANSQALSLPQPTSKVELLHNLISPDGDGQDDVLTIQYDLDFIGGNARVMVYDLEGRLVKRIAENELLSAEEGFFTWDGSDERRGKAPVGAYVILVEVVRPDTGRREVYKLPCAVVAGF